MTRPREHRRPMSSERWQRVEEALAAAIECNTAERDRVIDERCGGDVDLHDEVAALLDAHDGPGPLDQLADAVAPAASWVRAQSVGWEGSRVGRYLVLELLGAGGMGLVYRARDDRLGRQVALKFLPPHLSTDASAKQRFLVEARAAAALDHPNVCTIHEIGETDDGQLFIAMQLYDGETLQARLKRGRLSFEEACPIALQIARGLARAHGSGIVHRDVKPSNVMLLPDGTVKILDFGIAQMDDVSLTGNGVPFGTLAYMSPEHVRGGTIHETADIWSLGVLLHEMLTGARPFGGDDRDTVSSAILTKDPELTATAHPDVPSGLDDLLRKALAKRPELRYPSMSAFADDLAALASPGDGVPPGGRFGASQRHPPLPATERRRAAVLVTTVSQYGALVEQIAPADAHRLVSLLRATAVDVVRRHGGLVNQAIGEEIVSLFGVPTAHEDDDLRAVRAALELHARVRELAAGADGAALRIQSGLHIGPVVAQRLNDGPRRYAIVGVPGPIASRLAAMAAPDALLLSPEYQRLVAPFVHTAPCAAAVLDPDGPPVTPYRVVGETGFETRLEASERTGLTPYVGRKSELALLQTHLARARAGEGRAIAVVGEAGAGKSRLLHEIRERVATARDIRVLQGRCRAYGDAAPYAPLIEVVRDALGLRRQAGDSAQIVAGIRAMDETLEPFLPLYLHLLSVPGESHPLPRHLQGEHLQAALQDALAALIAVLAGPATLVVLLEDWHWADAASRAALGRMMEIVSAQTLLFIATTRPERESLADWPEETTRIQLDPLEFAPSAAIVQAVLRVDRLPEDLARRLYERTGGNPFFLEQTCCALLEQGAVAAREGEAVADGGLDALSLPDTVQAVISTRLDNLEPHAREVVRVAAVIGRDFEHQLLAAVLGPRPDLGPAIARLKACGLIRQTSVRPEAAYRFTHVLTQEVSYESLLGHQRKVLHDAIGREIERCHADDLDEHSALLAHHFGRADAWREAVHYGRRAAQRASALSQFADALTMLDQVLAWLAHLPEDEARADLKAALLLEQERECETLGLRGRQRKIIAELIAHVTQAGLSARLAEAYLREGDLLTLLKQFNAADRALTTALRVSREWGDAALERNALRSIGLLRWHEGRHAEALAITEDALAIARACDDELAVAGDLSNLSNILKSMGRYTTALPRLEEALALPALAQDPRKLAYTLHNLANVHRAMGNLEPAMACLQRADEISRIHLLPIQRSFHLTSFAHIDLQHGRVESALRRYREAVALSRRARHASGLVQSLRALGEVLFGLGKHDEATPCLREAALLFAQMEDRESEAVMWSRVGAAIELTAPLESADAWRTTRRLRQQLGDAHGELEALEGLARAIRRTARSPDEPIDAFEAALALASTLGDTHHQLTLRNALGILEWERGAYAAALVHYEAALGLVRCHGDRVHEGLILNSLGVTLSRLDRPEEARTALEQSIALNRETGERLLQAHALTALGHVCRTTRRLDRAAQCFAQSLELRRALGDRTGEGWMLRRIAETQSALGDETAARDAADGAAWVAAETGDAELLAACGLASTAVDR